MRTTTIHCDRCGAVGPAETFNSFLHPFSRGGSTVDLCAGCSAELRAFLKVEVEPELAPPAPVPAPAPVPDAEPGSPDEIARRAADKLMEGELEPEPKPLEDYDPKERETKP